jgi:hypothetical protein
MNLVSRCANPENCGALLRVRLALRTADGTTIGSKCLPAHAKRPCSAVFSKSVAGLHHSHAPNRICTNPDGEICHRSSLIRTRVSWRQGLSSLGATAVERVPPCVDHCPKSGVHLADKNVNEILGYLGTI